MKKTNWYVAALLLLTILLIGSLAACGGGDATTEESSESATTEETAEGLAADDGKVYELSLSTHDPATSNKTKFHQEWADKVMEASGGRLQITVYAAGALAGGTAALDTLRTGACDIAWIYPAYFPGQFPKSEVLTLPFGFDTVPQATNVLWDLYESEPALQEELSEFVPIMMHSNPSNIIATIDKYPISKMSDLKGLKFRASAGAASDLLLAWGATPMQMAPGDIFQAVEKGTVEGYVFDLSGIISFSLQEVTANYTDMPVYLGPYYLLMNRSSFEALPEDLQQIISDHSDRDTSLEMAYVYEGDERRGRDVILEAGGNFVEVSDADEAEFREAGQTLLTNWIETNTADGFDAQAFADKARELAEKYHIDRDALNAELDEMGL
ncbi:MAG: TRAP transporter substrate-binding protein [Clostridiales Family XIII bacterium]|nr:TRAP transporter substrate-binding protein [Clostridiales Family XIII bacterium]